MSSKTGVKLPISFYPSKKNSIYEYKNIIDKLEKPSSIIVAVPDHLHYEILEYAIKKRHHVLVVKPLTPTYREGKKLVNLARKYNVYASVEFHKRWDKQNRILRDIYKDGKLGEPLYSWTEYSQRKSIPTQIFKSWVEKNNILQYLGIHYIDIVRYVTNATPTRVMAIGQKNFLKTKKLDVYDSIQCIIEWQTIDSKTFTQTLLVNWIDPETSSSMSDQKIKFVGTYGRYEGDQKERGLITNFDNEKIEHINPDFCRSFKNEKGLEVWEGYGIQSIITFINDVHDIICKKKSPIDYENIRPTFSESLFSTSVIESAMKSLNRRNIWIKIRN